VQPELESLAAETGETATLEVLAEGRALILSEVTGQHLVTVAAEIGTLWPLHATSTGKILLAGLPSEERLALLEAPLERYTNATITDVEELERDLEIVTARGFALAIEELEVGAGAVACAVRDSANETVGAISLGGPTSRLDRQRLESFGSRLLAAAERLAKSLP